VRNINAIFSCSGGPGANRTKSDGAHCAELVFLHLMGSMGWVVCSGASRVLIINVLFFMLGGSGAYTTKNVPRHITLKLCLCIWCDL
jgi:hypothetical protein